jgi:hypothetical protein
MEKECPQAHISEEIKLECRINADPWKGNLKCIRFEHHQGGWTGID